MMERPFAIREFDNNLVKNGGKSCQERQPSCFVFSIFMLNNALSTVTPF